MKRIVGENNRLPIFTKRFRELQGERTNTEFADFLGISRQTVGFYCNGDRIPDAVVLRQIADKCEVSVDWLLGLSNEQTVEAEVRQICNYTGLSEKTIERLHRLKCSEEDPKPAIELIDNLVASGAILNYADYAWRAALADIQSAKAPDLGPLKQGEEGFVFLRQWASERDTKLFDDACKRKGDASMTIEITAGEAHILFSQRARNAIMNVVQTSLRSFKQKISKEIDDPEN